MRLPTEVIDMIVSDLLEASQDPNFPYLGYSSRVDWDALIRCNGEIRRVWSPALRREFETSLFALKPDVKTLLKLRLVSREWYTPATIFLCNYHWWPLKFDSLSSLANAAQICKLDVDGKPNLLPHLVRKLEMPQILTSFTFKRFYTKLDETIEQEDEEDSDEELAIRESYHDKLRRGAERMHYDKTTEHSLLKEIFAKIDGVEAFGVSFPAVAVHDREYGAVDCYDMQALSEITATIQHGLQLPAFDHLVNLRLYLPSTWYVVELASAISQEKRDRLRHLYIEMVDESGCGGSNDYSRTLDNDDEILNGDIENDHYYPKTNVQWECPNRKYQQGLWDFVASCPNLESLGVKATHYLDLDLLNWRKSPTSRGLRVLMLNRVWASTKSILNLLQPGPSTGAAPQLRRIMLQEVKIKSSGGNWVKIFKYLKWHCPELEFGNIYNLSYFTDHEHFEHNNRIWENASDVWSESRKDLKALFYLMEQLVKKAGGKECCPGPGPEQVENIESERVSDESDDEEDYEL